MNDIGWVEDLIKGKITELIFEQMFREDGRYVIFHYGYEYTAPELVKVLRNEPVLREDLKDARKAPDYILVKNGERGALVEVKFRSNFNAVNLLEMARKIHEQWGNAYLFVASKTGFSFDDCKTIIDKNGSISNLDQSIISEPTQIKYLEILNRYVGQN